MWRKRSREPAHNNELRWLTAALAEMPEEVRRAFLLRKRDRLSHQTIATQMGIPVARVEALLRESVLHLAPPGKSAPATQARDSGTCDEQAAQCALGVLAGGAET